ncbi:MAG: glycosyltransferase family 4 protein [Verrucomicrobiota bacterium]|nr:glycosyltransferase family 4 protein [Verrucomicrobiota bacterium]
MKKALRNTSLFLRYAFHWIRLTNEIRYYKAPPILLCMANPGSIGGTELQIQIIAEALKSRLGDCVVLLSGKLEGDKSNLFVERLKSLKIPCLRLESLGLVPYDQWPFLKKRTARLLGKAIGNSKICHFFNPSSTVLTPVMKSIGLAVYYMETGMPTAEGWWKTLHTTIGQFDYVTSVSLAGLHRLESLYGYQGPSCVTPSMFRLPPGHFLCRKPMKGVFDIVYFGRMTRGKGVDLLIRAFHHLIKEFPSAKLSLIGSGERVPLLRDLVQELQLSDHVQFTDWLQNEALFSRLIASDLFCLPSFSEGLPSSILEAMSIGLPVVATDVGGVSEIIEHDVSGILIPPRDEEALTKVLLELADAPLRRLQLREEALLRWKKVGTQEVIINQLMTAYQI